MNLCYMEDFIGGFICYSEDKEYFLKQETNPKICYEGIRKEVEDYIGNEIKDEDIFLVGTKLNSK